MMPVSSSEADNTPTLRLIGYWCGPGEEHWPDPALFVDREADAATQRRVSDYLRAGTCFVATAGHSLCRLCGTRNGSTELTDGKYFVWPEGVHQKPPNSSSKRSSKNPCGQSSRKSPLSSRRSRRTLVRPCSSWST